MAGCPQNNALNIDSSKPILTAATECDYAYNLAICCPYSFEYEFDRLLVLTYCIFKL